MPNTRRTPASMRLTEDERATLTNWSCGTAVPTALARRSRIILKCATGASDADVAKDLDLHPGTVAKWRRRFFDQRIDGLLGGQRAKAAAEPHVPQSSLTSDVEQRNGIRMLKATILQARAGSVGAIVATVTLALLLWQHLDQREVAHRTDDRRYIERIALWEDYKGATAYVHFENRSAASLLDVAIGDRGFEDQHESLEFVIDVGRVPPCRSVTLAIDRKHFGQRKAGGRYVFPWWKSGWLMLRDPVGPLYAETIHGRLEFRRGNPSSEPVDRPDDPTETYLLILPKEESMVPKFINIPTTAEPLEDCAV